jgi:hypothetical protein
MLPELPIPVATYLAAEKTKDAEMLSLCFAADALVHDEGRDYRGLDAIKSWKREALDIRIQVFANAAQPEPPTSTC